MVRAANNTETLIVRVPITFRRRCGRKELIAPITTPACFPAPHRGESPAVKALARAFRWRKLLEDGAYATVEELATAERVNASYLGRLLRLTLLAPEIVEAVLNGQEARITLDPLMRPLTADWKAQKVLLCVGDIGQLEPFAVVQVQ